MPTRTRHNNERARRLPFIVSHFDGHQCAPLAPPLPNKTMVTEIWMYWRYNVLSCNNIRIKCSACLFNAHHASTHKLIRLTRQVVNNPKITPRHEHVMSVFKEICLTLRPQPRPITWIVLTWTWSWRRWAFFWLSARHLPALGCFF